MTATRRWRLGLLAGAAVCAVAAVGFGLMVRDFWAMPDDGTDGAGMASVSFVFMFLIAVGGFLTFVALAIVHRFAERSRLDQAAQR